MNDAGMAFEVESRIEPGIKPGLTPSEIGRRQSLSKVAERRTRTAAGTFATEQPRATACKASMSPQEPRGGVGVADKPSGVDADAEAMAGFLGTVGEETRATVINSLALYADRVARMVEVLTKR